MQKFKSIQLHIYQITHYEEDFNNIADCSMRIMHGILHYWRRAKTEIDQDFFATLEKGGTSIFYKSVKCDVMYRKNSSSKWKNSDEILVWLDAGADWIYIDKGQIFVSLDLYGDDNIYIMLNMVNAAYKKATNSNRKYFLASSLTSNTEKSETIINGHQYKIIKFDTSSLVL